MKRQLFQPLMVLNLEFDYRPKSNLQRPRDVSIQIPFSDIPFSPYKLGISMFLAELLSYATRHEQANGALYLFIEIPAFCVSLELLICHLLDHPYAITWSAVVLTVCVIIDIAYITILTKKRLRNEVRRRLHF